VRAPGADPNGNSSGSNYVIFGAADNDRMIGRGGADSFDGGAGNDYIHMSSGDFELVDSGTGTDTL